LGIAGRPHDEARSKLPPRLRRRLVDLAQRRVAHIPQHQPAREHAWNHVTAGRDRQRAVSALPTELFDTRSIVANPTTHLAQPVHTDAGDTQALQLCELDIADAQVRGFIQHPAPLVGRHAAGPRQRAEGLHLQ
jgi:hypothetical protein